MRLRLKSIVISLFLIVGISPAAQAADVRVIDIAQITWNGATAPIVSTNEIASAITNEVNPNWISFTTLVGDPKDRSISFTYGQTLNTPVRVTAPLACERGDFVGFMNTVRNEV